MTAPTTLAAPDPAQTHLCECGCGEPTRLAAQTNRRQGRIQGQPSRFLPGHNHRGAYGFWSRVVKADDGCWVWTGRTNTKGYGLIGIGGGRRQHVHRWYWEQLHGAVEDGLELDHLCRNRVCVNPAHLEPVTHAENMRRGVWKASSKTHCPHGHEYTEENTRLYRGRRHCRACHRIYDRKRRAHGVH